MLFRETHLSLRKIPQMVDTISTLKFEYIFTWNNCNYHTMKYKSTKMEISSDIRESFINKIKVKVKIYDHTEFCV